MPAAKSVLKVVVVVLQFCLGFWQIGKLTPVAGILRATVAWLFSTLPFGLGTLLSPDYAQLKTREGRVFKLAPCFVTVAVDETNGPSPVPGDNNEKMKWTYLGVAYSLKREDNILFVGTVKREDNILSAGTVTDIELPVIDNEPPVDYVMKYYFTGTIWSSLKHVRSYSNSFPVFLKGYKGFWENVATGGIMSFSELLDCLILENQTFKRTHNSWLLPVNLSVSEEKLLKALNLVGLFLQTRNVHWLIPTVVSLVSIVMEFITPLRVWIYGRINFVFCNIMHFLFHSLQSVSTRRQVYSLGKWVEKLKPSNDVQYRVVKGNICAVIGGGAKTCQRGATLAQYESGLLDFTQDSKETDSISKEFKCDDVTTFKCSFYESKGRCDIEMFVSKDRAHRDIIISSLIVQLHCTRDEFNNVVRFVSRMAHNKSGSMKYCEHNRVRVRGFEESVIYYVKSRYPPVYELQLNDVVVE